MRQQYIAHFIRDERTGVLKIHSVQEHCQKVAKYAKNYAMAVKCPAIGELAGMLHDMG